MILDENKKVLEAFHGTTKLNLEEIEKYYGSERKFMEFDLDIKGESYQIVKGNFEVHVIPLFLICVDLYDMGDLKYLNHISDYKVIKLSSSKNDENYISTSIPGWIDLIKKYGQINGVVWAQGTNKNDSILNFDLTDFKNQIETNVTYILETLSKLLLENLIKQLLRRLHLIA